jgi:uncharacterized membrane protein YvbJ
LLDKINNNPEIKQPEVNFMEELCRNCGVLNQFEEYQGQYFCKSCGWERFAAKKNHEITKNNLNLSKDFNNFSLGVMSFIMKIVIILLIILLFIGVIWGIISGIRWFFMNPLF